MIQFHTEDKTKWPDFLLRVFLIRLCPLLTHWNTTFGGWNGDPFFSCWGWSCPAGKIKVEPTSASFHVLMCVLYLWPANRKLKRKTNSRRVSRMLRLTTLRLLPPCYVCTFSVQRWTSEEEQLWKGMHTVKQKGHGSLANGRKKESYCSRRPVPSVSPSCCGRPSISLVWWPFSTSTRRALLPFFLLNRIITQQDPLIYFSFNFHLFL